MKIKFSATHCVSTHVCTDGHFIQMFRLGQQLNVAYERTPENLFYNALCAAEKLSKMPQIKEYTTTESIALENLTGIKC